MAEHILRPVASVGPIGVLTKQSSCGAFHHDRRLQPTRVKWWPSAITIGAHLLCSSTNSVIARLASGTGNLVLNDVTPAHRAPGIMIRTCRMRRRTQSASVSNWIGMPAGDQKQLLLVLPYDKTTERRQLGPHRWRSETKHDRSTTGHPPARVSREASASWHPDLPFGKERPIKMNARQVWQRRALVG